MCRKRNYPGIEEAQTHAESNAAQFGTLPMIPYECPHCGWYHLTSDGDVNRKIPVKPDPPPSERQLIASQWYEWNRKKLKSRKRFLKLQ